MHPYVRAVHTARTHGPYVRVVRIGLKSVKTTLKSVDFDVKLHKNKLTPFYGPLCSYSRAM